MRLGKKQTKIQQQGSDLILNVLKKLYGYVKITI